MPPTTEEVECLVEDIAVSAEALFVREGFGPEEVGGEFDEDALSLIQSASIAGRSADVGRGVIKSTAGAL